MPPLMCKKRLSECPRASTGVWRRVYPSSCMALQLLRYHHCSVACGPVRVPLLFSPCVWPDRCGEVQKRGCGGPPAQSAGEGANKLDN